MQAYLLFILLVVLNCSTYLIWPSRYNVLQHLTVGFCFIGFFVPIIVLNVQDEYATRVVDLYYKIILVGTLFLIIGLYIGFFTKRIKTNFTFDVLSQQDYEDRVIRLTKIFLIIAITGLILSYAGMGFVPMFAKDPISAKLFRNEYQGPYIRVAILFRSSFYILTCVFPIGCIIWYKYRSKLFLVLLILTFTLMVVSLQRGPAFGGILFAFVIIMSFKSRFHFLVLMLGIVGIYLLSAVFYIIVGAKSLDSSQSAGDLIAASAPDVSDQLHFLEMFDQNNEWTYGRTIYGGLIPNHYKWNPAVYTLEVVNPGQDINTLDSGGLRLPLPMWGYVAFEWPGVIFFCIATGFLTGYFLSYLKFWFHKYPSIITRISLIGVYAVVFSTIIGFTSLSFTAFPNIFITLFYMYRINWK